MIAQPAYGCKGVWWLRRLSFGNGPGLIRAITICNERGGGSCFSHPIYGITSISLPRNDSTEATLLRI